VQPDEEITSEQLDDLLDEAQTLSAIRPTDWTEVRLYVAVDPETLQELEQRAATEGTDLNAAAAHALRAGAQAG
jgi:predicted HicB family RNase H-like nuclease